jgi:hypothetical protein
MAYLPRYPAPALARSQPMLEDPTNPDEDELLMQPEIRTRAGYMAPDVVRGLTVALQTAGSESAAKSLHYSADLVSSGCIDHWQKLIWDYVIDHVGIASPRIFFFLRKTFGDLDAGYAGMTSEAFYREPTYQRQIAECILVTRLCNRKPALKMPRVPPETHTDEWVNSIFDKAPEATAVRTIWKQGLDARILYRGGNEFVEAINRGGTERALFFLKWLAEEETAVRRELKSSLAGQQRGPAALPEKARKSVGMYICSLCAEIYRELSGKGKIKMNEEFQALMQLYAFPDKRLSAKRRNDILILMIQILCEVPRWSVPSASVLVADQAGLLRALGHAEGFFREVLAYDAPAGNVAKEIKKKKPQVAPGEKPLTAKEKKEAKMREQMDAMDAMVNQIYGL